MSTGEADWALAAHAALVNVSFTVDGGEQLIEVAAEAPAADVADRERMEEIVRETKARFGATPASAATGTCLRIRRVPLERV